MLEDKFKFKDIVRIENFGMWTGAEAQVRAKNTIHLVYLVDLGDRFLLPIPEENLVLVERAEV